METVDWSQNPLGDKSEARGVRVDEDKPVEVKVRQRGQLPASPHLSKTLENKNLRSI